MVESNLEGSNTSTSSQSSEESVIVSEPVALDDYCLVGWDMDVTGRKLLDEICHVAGYTPDDAFSLYIMPYGELTSVAKKRHQIRIVTVGNYRIIKDVSSNKMLKTKSALAALGDFLDWLEMVNKKSGKNGVLLICHESYKFNPHMLIKSLQKLNLMERFCDIVKGFVDCHTFAKKKCEQTMVSFSIRVLSKVLLSKDNVEIHKASDRARLAYDIVQHLCAGDSEIGNGAASPNKEIVRTVLPFTTSVQSELKVLTDLQTVLSRQNTLKPIFAQFLGFKYTTTYHERRNALQLRKYLVDAYVDYEMLKTAWSKGKDALEELINDKLTGDEIPANQKADLLSLLINHFENPEDSKKKGRRIPGKSSFKKSPATEKIEPKESETVAKDVTVCSELTLDSDIIKPIQNNASAVKVN